MIEEWVWTARYLPGIGGLDAYLALTSFDREVIKDELSELLRRENGKSEDSESPKDEGIEREAQRSAENAFESDAAWED